MNDQLCVTCHKPMKFLLSECARCGQPVHYDEKTGCGAWILDSWHPEADEGNEFWCASCDAKEQQEAV